jgi:hypothetical protein
MELTTVCSMVDVFAQTDIVTHQHFIPYLDVSKSVRLIENIFTKTERAELLKKLEPSRPVHVPWFEQTAEDNVSWEHRSDDNYNGASAGGVFGPSAAMLQLARKGCLASMFFFIFPLLLFRYIAFRTQAYAYNEWVVPTAHKDKHGNTTKHPILTAIIPSCKTGMIYSVTANFLIAWIGILNCCGAFFTGDNNRGVNCIYTNPPHGVSVCTMDPKHNATHDE